MKPDKVIYEEIPYAYTIRFEGKVVIPVNTEEQALFEANKAIEKAMEKFEVWDGEKGYCNPSYGVWHDGFTLSRLVKVKKEGFNGGLDQQTTGDRCT